MSTPSMLLLCGGAAACLAGVWSLAGLSESSSLRSTPRVQGAAAVGLLGAVAVYVLAPAALRSELLLPALFAVACVLALATGAAKLEGALAARQGPLALRRASGLVLGAVWGLVAVGAASLELVLSSLSLARFGWAYMLPLVGAACVVFAGRARLAGGGAISLGRRGLVLGVLGVLALGGGRALVSPKPASAAVEPPAAVAAPEAAASAAPAVEAPSVAVSAAPSASPPVIAEAGPSSSAPPSPSAAPSVASASAPAPGQAGQLQIDALESRGMLEADARGGVQRRFDKLQACLAVPKNQQAGTLSLKVGVDSAGSVNYSRVTGGDLSGTPLAGCLLPVFYKMGFAAPASNNAYFAITLRAPP